MAHPEKIFYTNYLDGVGLGTDPGQTRTLVPTGMRAHYMARCIITVHQSNSVLAFFFFCIQSLAFVPHNPVQVIQNFCMCLCCISRVCVTGSSNYWNTDASYIHIHTIHAGGHPCWVFCEYVLAHLFMCSVSVRMCITECLCVYSSV